jgi:uncharacterized membrane protein (UPF0182 family)
LPSLIDASGPARRSFPRFFAALLLLVAVAIVAFTFGPSLYVNLLWFRSLDFGSVYVRTLAMQLTMFAVSAVATWAILFFALSALRRSRSDALGGSHSILINGQPVTLRVGSVLTVLTRGVPLLVAFIVATSAISNWPVFALFLHAPGDASFTDPVLHRTLGFYLFTLPALELVCGWLLTLAVLVAVAAVAFALITGGAQSLEKPRVRTAPPWRSFGFAAAFLLFALAVDTYISRFDTLLEPHTIFTGATYTDAHIYLPGALLICAALLLGVVIAILGAVRKPSLRSLLLSVAPAVLCFLAVNAVGAYVSSFIVKPNELDRERPFIAANIDATRRAFGLDHFQRQEFPAETTVDAADPAHNQATLQNIRLWDWHALQDSLRQVQEIRTYYDFPDVDIDRYSLNGTTREVMLAARELNVDKLPDSSRNWINERLIYTHGYGITMNPVNGFTPEGLPTLLLSNMPVQSTVPGLTVTRPEIYFGQLTDTDVYVKTHQQEFDYPQGQNNTLTTYQGTGGIPIGGFFRRLFIALDRSDLSKLPFSDDVTSDSRLLMRRDIRRRVAALAPFLIFDHDPYIVVGDDGRLHWILDAFTAASTYPGSTSYSLNNNDVNYARNSVKVVIDAYNGDVSFYVFDAHDPIINAWRNIFPSLFRDASLMPADLHRHIRYAEDLFQVQSQVYALYHMDNPSVFFNREDLWTVATETGTDADGNQTTMPMQPNFVLMKLPGESQPEFISILPFTPANRNNLIGWIAGRCDPADYGTAIVYDFPKTRLVDGPQQIEARIDQNAQLSGQLTLWNQQGSHVRRGSLLVIPMGKALLYAEPIYLQAAQSPMPELRLVVLALQDRLAYGPTFESALASLFGGQTSSLSANPDQSAQADQSAPAQSTPTSTTPQPTATQRSLIQQASQDFDDYQRLTAQGKLSEAGQKLDDLKRTLSQLSAQQK